MEPFHEGLFTPHQETAKSMNGLPLRRGEPPLRRPAPGPLPALIEFHLFVEHFQAPTGRIQSQTMLHVFGRDIFRESARVEPYNVQKLLQCVPWTKDLLTSLAPTGFVLSLNVCMDAY